MFTDRLARQTRQLGLATLAVDPSITDDALTHQVATIFSLDDRSAAP